MTVSSINTISNLYLRNIQSGFQQQARDFKALGDALQSGDLSTAQAAFAAFQKDIQSNPGTVKSGALPAPDTQANKDFQALQSALQAGDLSAATSAFAALRQDVKGIHHHRHHHHSSDGDSDDSSQATTSTSSTSATSSMIGSLLDEQA